MCGIRTIPRADVVCVVVCFAPHAARMGTRAVSLQYRMQRLCMWYCTLHRMQRGWAHGTTCRSCVCGMCMNTASSYDSDGMVAQRYHTQKTYTWYHCTYRSQGAHDNVVPDGLPRTAVHHVA